MNGACQRRPAVPARVVPSPKLPAALRSVVQLTRAEVLESCGRLVLAHRALTAAGAASAAGDVALVFELLEQRLSV
jgi:hypothetical protein